MRRNGDRLRRPSPAEIAAGEQAAKSMRERAKEAEFSRDHGVERQRSPVGSEGERIAVKLDIWPLGLPETVFQAQAVAWEETASSSGAPRVRSPALSRPGASIAASVQPHGACVRKNAALGCRPSKL